MNANFEFAVQHVIYKSEGGFVDHKSDRGLATKYGITLVTLSNFRGVRCTKRDIADLTIEEAILIYREDYWDQFNLDYLVSPVIATIVFDQIINRGAIPTIRSMQRLLVRMYPNKRIIVDGILGPDTALLVNESLEFSFGARLIIEAQKAYISLWQKDPSQSVFLKGWLARTWGLLELF